MSEEKVIIEETAEETPETPEVDASGLSAEEVASAKEFGIIPKEENKEAEKDVKTEPKKEVEGDKKVDEEVGTTDPADFEQMEEAYNKDETKFHKNYTANAKALYFKHKRNKQLRQEAQEAAEAAGKERDFLSTKEKAYQKQLADIEVLIDRIDSGDENITTADIRKVIAFKKEEAKKEEAKVEDKKDDKPTEKQIKYLQEKSKNTEMLGKSKYEDFAHYVDLANEVVAKDKDVAMLITKAYHDPEVDEEQLVEKIVKYARLHPDFGKETKKEDKKEDSKIDRIVANAGKKKSSASLSTGSGRREVGYDDLTLSDIAQMSQEQYNKLPSSVREKLMMEASK